MRKLIILLVLVAAALALVVSHQGELIPIPDISPEVSLSESQLDPHSEHKHHPHDHAHDGDIPDELEEYIESQRIPASDIPVTLHGDGKATIHTNGQYSTVLMMVIDEDGTRRMVERQITPEGTLVVPYENNN